MKNCNQLLCIITITKDILKWSITLKCLTGCVAALVVPNNTKMWHMKYEILYFWYVEACGKFSYLCLHHYNIFTCVYILRLIQVVTQQTTIYMFFSLGACRPWTVQRETVLYTRKRIVRKVCDWIWSNSWLGISIRETISLKYNIPFHHCNVCWDGG